MKKERFSEEQIIAAVRQMDAGRPATEIGRELGGQQACDLRLEEEVWRVGGE